MLTLSNLNDYELVYMAQEYNEDAKKILYAKYNPVIHRKSNNYYQKFFETGIDKEDVIQECYIGLEKAIANFNQDNTTTFYTFANLCMDRHLQNEIIKYSRQKNKILNGAVPLESLDDDIAFNLLNILENTSENPEGELLSLENVTEITNAITNELTNYEQEIFKLKINGWNCKEISKKLNTSEKSVYNAMQRIREKLKKFFNN